MASIEETLRNRMPPANERTAEQKPVCLTGGAGFLGRHILERLVADGRTARCVDVAPFARPGVTTFAASIGDREAVREALSGCDTLIHLAWTGTAANPPEGFDNSAQDNLVASLGMLESARAAGIKKIIFASSGGTVYGTTPEDVAVTEDHACRPISGYGAGKLAFEGYAHAFCHINDMTFVALRVSNLYGPGQRGDKGQGLVAALQWRALASQPSEVWGDGSAIRDYIYVDDAADAFARALAYAGPSTVINIGSGIGRSVRDVVTTVEDVMGQPVPIVWKPGRSTDVPYNVLDSSRAAALLGWHAQTDFADGVKSALSWSRDCLRNKPRTSS